MSLYYWMKQSESQTLRISIPESECSVSVSAGVSASRSLSTSSASEAKAERMNVPAIPADERPWFSPFAGRTTGAVQFAMARVDDVVNYSRRVRLLSSFFSLHPLALF